MSANVQLDLHLHELRESFLQLLEVYSLGLQLSTEAELLDNFAILSSDLQFLAFAIRRQANSAAFLFLDNHDFVSSPSSPVSSDPGGVLSDESEMHEEKSSAEDTEDNADSTM